MLKQMKKTLGILLAVCFLISVTAAAVSAGPAVVKEKKNFTTIMKDVKTKFVKHHHKNMTRNGGKDKKMAVKTGTDNKIPMKTETGNKIPMKTETNKNMHIKSGTSKDMAVKS